MQIKKSIECISQTQFIAAAFIVSIISIMFYFVCATPPFSKPSAAYAAELHFSADSQFEADLSSGRGRNKAVKNYLKKAERYYKKGKYGEAIAAWEEVLSIDSANKKATEGINKARKKIEKIKNFFGDEVFRDLRDADKVSLKDCIRIAEEGSLLLELAKEQIILNKIKVWEARRAFLPSLTLSWAETRGIQSAGKTESLEYGIEGKQPAFRSGELMYALAQSKADLDIAEQNHGKVKSELYLEVAEAYYTFVEARKSLEYTKGLYENVKPFYEMAKKKHEKAVVPDIEHLNVESKINQMYYKSISVETDFELAKLALEQKLNIEDSGSIDIAFDMPSKSVDKNMATCLSLAMENRPDLKMNEFAVKSTEYGKKIAQAKEMPQIDLAGHYKQFDEVFVKNASGLESKLDPKRRWYAGLEVAWPFLGSTSSYSFYKKRDPATLSTFTAGTTGSEIKGTTWKLDILDNIKQFTEAQEAEVANARAEKELDDTRKKVVMEVKKAFYGYEKAHIQLEATRKQREFHEKEIKILKFKHDLGEAELSELFESFARLMEGNEAYFKAEKELYTSVATLNKAIGLPDYF